MATETLNRGLDHGKLEVGIGATICGYTDRNPATVVGWTKTTISVTQDFYHRTDDNGMSEMQDYEYTTNPNGYVQVFSRRKDGSYRLRGTKYTSLVVGKRERYYDFSF